MSKTLKKTMYPIAYILFPIVNFMIAQYTDYFSENYSFVGNELHHSFLLYIWGCLCGGFFYIATKEIIEKMNYRLKHGQQLLAICCFGMIASVFIPYLPEIHPFLGQLHIYISIFSTVGYVLLFFHILLEFAYMKYDIYKKYYPLYATLVGSCLVNMILFGGVNTIMEFAFSCGQAILLSHMITTLDKEISYDDTL